MAHDFDPALLEDPEWQEALRAAESPQPRRARARRESPSATAGAAEGSYEEFLASGGLRAHMHAPLVVDLDRSGHQDEDLGSARTSYSNRRNVPRNNTQPSPIHPLPARLEDDDELSIISPPRSYRPPSGPSNPSSTFIPFYAQTTTPPRAPTTSTTSPHSVIDLDHQMALELQRQLDGDVDDIILEIDDNDTGFERVAPSAASSHIPPSAASISRHNAPIGPARGAFGVVSRHGDSHSASPPGLSRNHTDGSVNYNGRNDASARRPARELPPISRSNTVPVSPAHQRSTLISGYDSSLYAPSAPLYSNDGRRNGTQGRRGNAPRRNAQWIVDGDPGVPDLDLIPISSEDDDERRLRGGVNTRQSQPTRRNEHRHVPREIVDHALSGRSTYARNAQVDRDRELAAALQGGYDGFSLPRAVHQRRPRGGQRNRGGRLGEFEVDTNDYEAMLRLSEQAPPVARGASSAAISSLPVVRASNDDCTICQGTAETAMVALPCLHNFHRECILPHLKTNRFCPNCRHELE